MNTDPLLDSDDEMYADENTRLDYSSSPSPLHFPHSHSCCPTLTVLRLRIISRLRGKEPTPPPDFGPYSVSSVNPLIALGAR